MLFIITSLFVNFTTPKAQFIPKLDKITQLEFLSNAKRRIVVFGMGFFEILMVAVVAIIFLGPEKLPKALVDVAKFIKAAKKTMDEAKDNLDREVNLSKIKDEALAYKNSITHGLGDVKSDIIKDIALDDLELEYIKESSLVKNQQHTHSAKDNSIVVKPDVNKTTLTFKNNEKIEKSEIGNA